MKPGKPAVIAAALLLMAGLWPDPAEARPGHRGHYCADYQSYYPHVQDCPSAWQRVVPRPPG